MSTSTANRGVNARLRSPPGPAAGLEQELTVAVHPQRAATGAGGASVHGARHFFRHFGEMFLAMIVGMMVLGGLEAGFCPLSGRASPA